MQVLALGDIMDRFDVGIALLKTSAGPTDQRLANDTVR
jgi:hypothetical protein